MAIDFKQFETLDTVAAIREVPAGNYLISDLGIFSDVNSTTPRAQIVDIVETQVGELEQVSRGGTEVNSIKMDKTILRNQEIPHYATEADVKTEDWQGLVNPASPDQSLAITKVIADKAERMRNHHLETVEATLARALFKQEAKAAKTDDGNVDFNVVFGTKPLDYTIDAAPGQSVYQQLAQIRRMLVKQYGAGRSYLDRFFCFCSPDLYDKLAGHPEVTSLVVNKVSEAARGAFLPVNTAGYDSYQIGNITFILADDDRYEIAEGSGLFVPKFNSAARSPFKLVHGPASRNQDIAAKGVISPYYQKVMTDRYGMVTIHQEASFIPLNLRPNYTLNVKLK